MSTHLMLQIRAESVRLYKDVNNIQSHNGLKKGDVLGNTIFSPAA